MSTLTEGRAWNALRAHAETMRKVHLRELFAAEPDRFKRFSRSFGDAMLLDFSKHPVTDETMALLFDLARERGVEQGIA
ncbi:MAG: hypothetical protein R8K47_07660, partial [Mariprofundaceae bacterium]